MRHIRDDRGMTLLELLITIAVGSIITIAATTVLLLGLRIYKQSTDTATRQNEVRVGLTVMEKLVAENPVTGVTETEILTTDGVLLCYEDGAIRTGADAPVMENVTGFEVELAGELLTFTVMSDEAEYTSAVRCRVEKPTDADAMVSGDLEALLGDTSLPLGVRRFLETLTSQIGSTGRIQTESGEGIYYSAWYNPEWNADTAWCACFVSWALEECSRYLYQVPKFASVDDFMDHFISNARWKTAFPSSGDLIFFDWIVDSESDPQHVGVVLKVQDGYVYTIEGNSSNRVALRKYPVGDPRILGYGVLAWSQPT